MINSEFFSEINFIDKSVAVLGNIKILKIIAGIHLYIRNTNKAIALKNLNLL